MIPYIDIHTHKGTETANDLYILNSTAFLESYYSYSVHPWYIDALKKSQYLKEAQVHLANKNCLAFGEIGLDRLSAVDFEFQKEIFKDLLEINSTYKKPIIIHCVKAHQELASIAKQFDFPFIIHGFNNNNSVAALYSDLGFYYSFGKALLQAKSNARKQLLNTSLDKIFFETDNSNLSIEIIYKEAANILNLEIDLLKNKCYENFQAIFAHQ